LLSCTPRLVANLTLEHNHHCCVPFLGRFKMFPSQQAPPFNTIFPNAPSCSNGDN
jgi:hypothetical protein